MGKEDNRRNEEDAEKKNIRDRHIENFLTTEGRVGLILSVSGWHRVFNISNCFIGWYHPKISGNRILTTEEASKKQEAINKQIDLEDQRKQEAFKKLEALKKQKAVKRQKALERREALRRFLRTIFKKNFLKKS